MHKLQLGLSDFLAEASRESSTQLCLAFSEFYRRLWPVIDSSQSLAFSVQIFSLFQLKTFQQCQVTSFQLRDGLAKPFIYHSTQYVRFCGLVWPQRALGKNERDPLLVLGLVLHFFQYNTLGQIIPRFSKNALDVIWQDILNFVNI